MKLDVVPVVVEVLGVKRTMYDLELNGRAIKGARSFTKAEAEQEKSAMLRSPVWKNAQGLM
jgi:hypothetical protein